MLISQAVAELQKILATHGDLELVTDSHCDSSMYAPSFEVVPTKAEQTKGGWICWTEIQEPFDFPATEKKKGPRALPSDCTPVVAVR